MPRLGYASHSLRNGEDIGSMADGTNRGETATGQSPSLVTGAPGRVMCTHGKEDYMGR